MNILKRILAGFAVSVVVAGSAFAAGDAGAGGVAEQKLVEGNKNFCSGKLCSKDLGDSRRKEIAKGQHPFAIVLTCSDSRVAPEYIFDQGLGDVFVVRTAGEVVDPITIGSIEYAAEHLHVPLLMVLGHSSCGAVKAAVESGGEGEGNIGAILKKIKPAVETAKAAKKDDAATLDLAVQENVKNVLADILANSKIMRELIEEGKVKVMMGEYRLDTGKVELIPVAAEKEKVAESEHELAGAK